MGTIKNKRRNSMKKTLKSLSAALIFALVLTALPFPSFAASESEDAEAEINAAAFRLAELGIYKGKGDEHSDFNLDDDLTRAEFAAVLARLDISDKMPTTAILLTGESNCYTLYTEGGQHLWLRSIFA
jgi:hypothetical protein